MFLTKNLYSFADQIISLSLNELDNVRRVETNESFVTKLIKRVPHMPRRHSSSTKASDTEMIENL